MVSLEEGVRGGKELSGREQEGNSRDLEMFCILFCWCLHGGINECVQLPRYIELNP